MTTIHMILTQCQFDINVKFNILTQYQSYIKPHIILNAFGFYKACFFAFNFTCFFFIIFFHNLIYYNVQFSAFGTSVICSVLS